MDKVHMKLNHDWIQNQITGYSMVAVNNKLYFLGYEKLSQALQKKDILKLS